MSNEPLPPSGEPPHERHPAGDAEALMPAWVPTAIGAVLVAMAALAVYTGLRYRNPPTGAPIVRTRRTAPSTASGGAPGEPEPGSSLVFPGDAADNTPAARQAYGGHSRAEITGTGTTINSLVRTSARRGMITNITPPDAFISVNDVMIGQASQFSGLDEVYDFPAPGSYAVHITAPGYVEQQIIVNVAENANQEIAHINVKLVRK
jgi:hypothetical protein